MHFLLCALALQELQYDQAFAAFGFLDLNQLRQLGLIFDIKFECYAIMTTQIQCLM